MSFNIVLQTNNSDERALDKDLTTIDTLIGALLDECDLYSPVVLIETDLSRLAAVNYFTIEAFGRSYFLSEPPRSVRSGLVEIVGHCDVLSSFKTAIREQRAIVRRQQSGDVYNLYLNDGSLRVYQNPYVLTEVFPSGFSGASFVLAVAGTAAASRGGE